MYLQSAPLEKGRRPSATGSKTGPHSHFLVEKEGDLHDIPITADAFPTRPDPLAGIEFVAANLVVRVREIPHVNAPMRSAS
jgi:hypothetical protein